MPRGVKSLFTWGLRGNKATRCPKASPSADGEVPAKRGIGRLRRTAAHDETTRGPLPPQAVPLPTAVGRHRMWTLPKNFPIFRWHRTPGKMSCRHFSGRSMPLTWGSYSAVKRCAWKEHQNHRDGSLCDDTENRPCDFGEAIRASPHTGGEGDRLRGWGLNVSPGAAVRMGANPPLRGDFPTGLPRPHRRGPTGPFPLRTVRWTCLPLWGRWREAPEEVLGENGPVPATSSGVKNPPGLAPRGVKSL